MPVTVKLASPFRRHTGGVESVTCSAKSLPQLFGELEERFPGLTRHLCTETGDPRRSLGCRGGPMVRATRRPNA